MRKSYLILAALAMCGLASCTVEPLPSDDSMLQAGETVVLEACSADELTKTSIDESTSAISWVAGDQISLFFGPGTAGGSCFTTSAGGRSASFSGSINAFTAGGEDYDGGTTYFWGVYPYNAAASCSNTSVTTTLPSEQVGKPGTFANGLNLSVGRSENLKMAFYNVCSMYRIKVGVSGIKSATFRTRGGEPLVGNATIEFVDGRPAVTSLTNASSELVLTPEGGEFVPDQYYYFEFFPTTAASGFEVTISTELQEATFTKEASRTFARNQIGGVSALETKVGEWTAKEGFITFEDLNAEYACLENFDTDSDGRISYAEALAVTSLDGLFDEHDGVETFPELRYFINVTDLAGAFTGCADLTEITIPPAVTTIGDEAFKGCTSLTGIVIPEGVTSIGASAFEGCTGLGDLSIPASVTSIGSKAFAGCTSTQTVEFASTTPCTIVADSFDSGTTFIVPYSAYNKYRLESIWKNYTIVSRVDDLSGIGSANSYIVSEAGAYRFRTVKGNSTESVGTVESVEVLWESFGTDTAPSVGDLVSGATYADGYITFIASGNKGNAVIAAKDASGTILWSWHIWMTDTPEDQVYNNNAGTMMDRNLGATSATPGDVQALGLMYQWGRKDPFLGGNQISYSTEYNQAKAASTYSWPSTVSSDSSNGTVAYAVSHPTTFITYNSSNYDWYYTGSSSTDNTRWQTSSSDKGLYDPCPPGYRVPDGGSSGVWSKAFGASSSWTTSSNWNSTNNGMNFGATDKKLGSSPTIWYPASGYLDDYDGTLIDVGYDGSCWSASPSGHNACYLDFGNNGYVAPSNYYSRAGGRSVRCFRE